MVKLRAFEPFASAEAALKEAEAVGEGTATPALVQFVREHLGSKATELGVADARLCQRVWHAGAGMVLVAFPGAGQAGERQCVVRQAGTLRGRSRQDRRGGGEARGRDRGRRRAAGARYRRGGAHLDGHRDQPGGPVAHRPAGGAAVAVDDVSRAAARVSGAENGHGGAELARAARRTRGRAPDRPRRLSHQPRQVSGVDGADTRRRKGAVPGAETGARQPAGAHAQVRPAVQLDVHLQGEAARQRPHLALPGQQSEHRQPHRLLRRRCGERGVRPSVARSGRGAVALLRDRRGAAEECGGHGGGGGRGRCRGAGEDGGSGRGGGEATQASLVAREASTPGAQRRAAEEEEETSP
eukprot:ctg_178.g134